MINIKTFLSGIGGILGAGAAIAAIITFFIHPTDFSDEFPIYKNKINRLINAVYTENQEKFIPYEGKSSMPNSEYKEILFPIASQKKNHKNIIETIYFFESYISCKNSFFCKVDNDHKEYDQYIYQFWFLVAPYVKEKIKKSEIKGFGNDIELYAQQFKAKLKK